MLQSIGKTLKQHSDKVMAGNGSIQTTSKLAKGASRRCSLLDVAGELGRFGVSAHCSPTRMAPVPGVWRLTCRENRCAANDWFAGRLRGGRTVSQTANTPRIPRRAPVWRPDGVAARATLHAAQLLPYKRRRYGRVERTSCSSPTRSPVSLKLPML